MFSFHTDIVMDEESEEKYLLILLHNENVLPKIDAWLNYLRLYQAAWFQGYFYSKPVGIQKLRERVEG